VEFDAPTERIVRIGSDTATETATALTRILAEERPILRPQKLFLPRISQKRAGKTTATAKLGGTATAEQLQFPQV
jgi:hypothetical protein